MASAATVDFTGFTSGEQFWEETFGTGNTAVTVTATGNTTNPTGRVHAVKATSPSFVRGLGVFSQNSSAGGIQMGEELFFELTPDTQVTSVSLSRTGTTPQSFELYMDGNWVFTGAVTAPNNASNPGNTVFDLASLGVRGSVFSVRGLGSTGVFVNNIVIAPVPLPATAPVLAGALVLGAVAVRRRRKAAEPEQLAA